MSYLACSIMHISMKPSCDPENKVRIFKTLTYNSLNSFTYSTVKNIYLM